MFRVLVLLAAYNGEKWICEQINSILKQKDVQVDILCSIDSSNDSTLELVRGYPNVKILPYGVTFGSAGLNFYRLFKDGDFHNYDYIALSDQDDIWLEDKLVAAIGEMRMRSAPAFSSNVTAFWEDGRQKEIIKSSPQTVYDHFFESPGPGCSFVLEKRLALKLQSFIRNKDSSELIDLHDWLIYAFVRSSGFKWFISSNSKLLYRQHENNQCGANCGLLGINKRYRIMKTGWYSNQVLKLFGLFEPTDPIARRIQRRNKRDSLFLLSKCYSFRRRKREKLLLSLAIILRLF